MQYFLFVAFTYSDNIAQNIQACIYGYCAPAWIFHSLGSLGPFIYLLCNIAAFFLCAYFFATGSHMARRLVPVLFLLTVTNGGHDYNLLFLPALVIGLAPSKYFSTRRGVWNIYLASVAAFLSAYLFSGLWKLFYVMKLLFSGEPMVSPLTLHIFELSLEDRGINPFLIQYNFLSFGLYLLGLALQMSCIVCLWRPRLIPFVGVFIFLFHMAVRQILVVDFYNSALVAVALLLSFPLNLRGGNFMRKWQVGSISGREQ